MTDDNQPEYIQYRCKSCGITRNILCPDMVYKDRVKEVMPELKYKEGDKANAKYIIDIVNEYRKNVLKKLNVE